MINMQISYFFQRSNLSKSSILKAYISNENDGYIYNRCLYFINKRFENLIHKFVKIAFTKRLKCMYMKF